MQYDIDLFCWEVPESKKYLQQDRGIKFERGGGEGVSACSHVCE